MTFEVPVSAVSRSRSRRGVGIVVALSALVALTAAVTGLWAGDLPVGGASGSAPASAPPFAAALASTGPRPAANPKIATPSVAREVPPRLSCHDVGPRSCERIVRAALRVLPADLPDVARASVWQSLVCNSDFDCPPAYLRESAPAGSVVLAFSDGSPSVAVNVVDWRYGSGIRLGLRAWIARSLPAID